MSIIITKLIIETDFDGTEKKVFPDFCIVKEMFCFDLDDDTFVTIGLGGGTEITKAQLKTRALDIHTRYPFQLPNPIADPEVGLRTNAEVETMVDDWCAEKNVS